MITEYSPSFRFGQTDVSWPTLVGWLAQANDEALARIERFTLHNGLRDACARERARREGLS
jgi:hypothetical protein